MSQRPNILWICTDQQRYDTIHALGNHRIKTPHTDRLIRDGVAFTRAYCQSPVCTPSRASFLTGRYARTTRCRQNGQQIPKEEKLLSRIFADHDYTCGLAGKLHLSSCAKVTRYSTGRITRSLIGLKMRIHSGSDRKDNPGTNSIKAPPLLISRKESHQNITRLHGVQKKRLNSFRATAKSHGFSVSTALIRIIHLILLLNT